MDHARHVHGGGDRSDHARSGGLRHHPGDRAHPRG
jgi:hypothetical protein